MCVGSHISVKSSCAKDLAHGLTRRGIEFSLSLLACLCVYMGMPVHVWGLEDVWKGFLLLP